MAMGETITSWDSLQTKLGEHTTVVTYDRLGLGKSDTTTAPRTIENLSRELHDFLTTQKIPGPYLFIGHSLGAFIVRKYQHDHPENVVGMLLIDPVHEDQFDRLMASKSAEEREKILMDREESLATLSPGELHEAVQYHQRRKAMKAVPYPTTIPITILASFQVGQGATAEERQIKKALFDDWLRQAPQIKLVSTTRSGHYIQDSEPALFLEEVKHMLDQVRSKPN